MIATEVKACRVKGCHKTSYIAQNRSRGITRGMCDKHYARWKKHGDPEIIERPLDGRYKHPLYRTHRKMIERCYSQNCPEYSRYGGRGITVSDRWLDSTTGFWSFVQDMGDKPSPKHSLDRLNNDDGYTPSNCRWATIWEQNSNQRSNNEIVGIHHIKSKSLWHASLQHNNIVHQKYFKNKTDAISYRKQLEVELLGGTS